MINKFDVASYLYLYESIVCFFTFGLFVFYAAYKHKTQKCIPSLLFVAVGFFFFFQGYAILIGLIARQMRTEPAWAATPFLDSQWWHTRVFGRVAMETAISFLQARKVYIEVKRCGKPLRRRLDTDGDDV